MKEDTQPIIFIYTFRGCL